MADALKKPSDDGSSVGKRFQSLTSSEIEQTTRDWNELPPPNSNTENNSIFYKNMEYHAIKGEGLDRASPPHELEPNNRNTDLSPEDASYQSALNAVRRALEALPDSNHKNELNGLFNAAVTLPSGEVARLAKTAEKKAEKWVGIPKVAPAWYQDRPASQLLPDFLIEHYALHLNGRMDSSHFEILDPSCGAAVRHWIKKERKFPKQVRLAASQERQAKKLGLR